MKIQDPIDQQLVDHIDQQIIRRTLSLKTKVKTFGRKMFSSKSKDHIDHTEIEVFNAGWNTTTYNIAGLTWEKPKNQTIAKFIIKHEPTNFNTSNQFYNALGKTLYPPQTATDPKTKVVLYLTNSSKDNIAVPIDLSDPLSIPGIQYIIQKHMYKLKMERKFLRKLLRQSITEHSISMLIDDLHVPESVLTTYQAEHCRTETIISRKTQEILGKLGYGIQKDDLNYLHKIIKGTSPSLKNG